MAMLPSIVIGQIIKKIGNPVLKKVAEKIGGGKVVEAIIDQLGPEIDSPGAVAELATENPEAFAQAVEAAASAESERWAALLAETSHASMFVAGARPAILWGCLALLMYAGVGVGVTNWLFALFSLLPIIPDIPDLPQPPNEVWETLTWLVPLLYGMRSLEGVMGSKRSSL